MGQRYETAIISGNAFFFDFDVPGVMPLDAQKFYVYSLGMPLVKYVAGLNKKETLQHTTVYYFPRTIMF